MIQKEKKIRLSKTIVIPKTRINYERLGCKIIFLFLSFETICWSNTNLFFKKAKE